jgi:tetratricopeptide (TPR) repeat protein
LAEGKREVATRLLDEAIALAERINELMALRWTQNILAERDLLEGHPGDARARLEPLLDRGEDPETYVTQLLPMLAWAHLDLGAIEQAEVLLQQALDRARAQRMCPALTEALRVQALLHLRQGRWEEARGALEEALVLCRAIAYPYAEAKALYVYGCLHQAKGDQEQAHKRLEAALAILNRLGERLYAELVERALATGA